MSKFIKFLVLTLIALCTFSSCAYERVDAGCEGILVNLYGDDKGVGEVSMCTGAVWYNPFTQDVFEYPIFVQTVDYEPFTTNSKEGSEFTLDPQVLINVETGKSPLVFRKYRKPMGELLNTVIYKYVKDACRTQLNKYETDYIVSHREEVEKAIESYLRTELKKEHFELGPLTTGLKYPSSIVESVNAKTKAIQEAQRVQNELAVVKAEAEKKVVAAQAEAEANKLRQQALTPSILQKMWIEKWDGHLPEVQAGGQTPMMLNLK